VACSVLIEGYLGGSSGAARMRPDLERQQRGAKPTARFDALPPPAKLGDSACKQVSTCGRQVILAEGIEHCRFRTTIGSGATLPISFGNALAVLTPFLLPISSGGAFPKFIGMSTRGFDPDSSTIGSFYIRD